MQVIRAQLTYRETSKIYPSEGVQSQNNATDGLALHPIQSVAASLQQVCLFWAQPEHLEQGPKNTESASVAKNYQAINGQYLKDCFPSDLFSNAVSSSDEGKKRWSYTFSPTCALMVCVCGHIYDYISEFNKNCGNNVLKQLIYCYIV